MTNIGIFPVKNFAKLSLITRDKLLNYDRMGLISPALRGKNNYRYYSGDQLAIMNMIRLQLESGISIAEIKKLQTRRTEKLMSKALFRQTAWLDEKIKRMSDDRDLLSTFQNIIHSVQGIDEESISVQFLDEEPIMLGEVNDYSMGRNETDALLSFYNIMGERYRDVNLSFPVWGVFPEERLKRRNWHLPTRYYFYNPAGHERRPSGRYAIGYARGDYGRTDDLYTRLFAYIADNSLEICGDGYEEYPLNEFCITDPSNYLIRVMLPVRRKK